MVLTIGRPPPMDRGPERLPLSRAIGARPASAAMLRRSIWPSFGQLGNEGSGNDGTNAWRGPEPPFNGSQLGAGRHEIGHPRLDLCNPAIEHGDDAANVGARYWVRGLLEAGGFLLTHLDKLAPAGRLRPR